MILILQLVQKIGGELFSAFLTEKKMKSHLIKAILKEVVDYKTG